MLVEPRRPERVSSVGAPWLRRFKMPLLRSLQRVLIGFYKQVAPTELIVCLVLCEPSQIMRQHLPPPRPVVVYVMAPEFKQVRDAFGMEDVR